MSRIHGNRALRRGAVVLIGLMGLVLLAGVFLKMDRLTTNPRSRVITVERLVDAGIWAHVAPGDTTPFEMSIDHIRVGERYYSSKPPIYPLLMAGESKLVQAFTGWDFYAHRVDFLRFLVLLNQVFPYLLALWMAFLFLQRHTDDPFVLYFMLAALGLGMLAFGYAATVNNHTPAAVLYLLAFLLGERFAAADVGKGWVAALVGLFCGFAFVNELPSGGIAVALVAVLGLKDWRRALWALPAFCLPVLAALFLYDHIAGSWLPFQVRPELFKYAGSFWSDPQGIDGLEPSKGSYLFHMFFGFRGLFSMTPLLLLGLWSYVREWRRGRDFYKYAFGGVLLGAVVLVMFVVFRTWNYGGDCIGMRWFICFSPLLMLMAFPLVRDMAKGVLGRMVLVLLLLWGIPWVLEAIFEEAFIVGTFEQMWVQG